MKQRLAPLLLSLFILGFSMTAHSEDDVSEPEQTSKYSYYYMDFKVDDTGAVTTTATLGLTLLKEDAVKEIKSIPLSYSTSAEKLEIIEAYTQKPDGKKIEVPKDNFQSEVNGGKDKGHPAFSDYTTMTIVFPDTAVGDTLYLKYVRTETEPQFPKQFSIIQSFYKNLILDDVRISVEMPQALNARYENNGLTEKTHKVENGHEILEWTYENKTPERKKWETGYTVEYERIPSVYISNYTSYAAMAKAYGDRANPKAAVTDRIRHLADDITKDSKTQREQAKALYDWIVENIAYAGNCIGIGSVVPRDTDFVLDNKMGDCKDHATLFQGLLAAKGITSSQALINASRTYKLTHLPIVSTVNHVINYIPSLDVFVDATSHMPFGMLPSLEYAKPVILVDGYRDGMTTPTKIPDLYQTKIETKIKIDAEGTAEGTVNVIANGYYAIGAHEAIKHLRADQEPLFLQNLIKQSGYEGTLELDRGKYDEATSTYQFGYKIKLKNYIRVGNPGAFYINPIITSSPVKNSARENREKNIKQEFTCFSAMLEEDNYYEFPNNIDVLGVPKNISASNNYQTYQSSYDLKGHILTAKRIYNDVTKGPTCAPDVYAAYKEIADKTWPDLTAQVVYK